MPMKTNKSLLREREMINQLKEVPNEPDEKSAQNNLETLLEIINRYKLLNDKFNNALKK